MTTADPYASLGVRRRINAAGALTRLGGAIMAPEVILAMAAASRVSVDIAELQDAASKRIAEVTGAGRLWYAIDDEKRTLRLIRAGTGHPKQTE